MSLAHHNVHPALITQQHFGRAGVNVLVIGKQGVNVVDAVRQFLVILGIHGNGVLERADALVLGKTDDAGLIGMAQLKGLVVAGLVENVLLHRIVSSFKIGMFCGLVVLVGFGSIFESLSHQGIDHSLLLFGKGLEHIGQSFVVLGLLILFLLAISRSIVLFLVLGLLLAVVGVIKADLLSGINNGLFLVLLPMTHDRVDVGAGVCSGQHKADLSDRAVQNIRPLLLELVGINTQRGYVAVLHKKLGVAAGFRFVECAVGVNAVLTVLQQRMAQNIHCIVVLMVPDQRDRLPVIALECVLADRASIGAFQIVTGSPATEIVPHFEFPPSVWLLSVVSSVGAFAASLPFASLTFLFRSSSALGSADGFRPIIWRISLGDRISFLVNLSAISASSDTGTSLNGSLKNAIDWNCDRAVLVRNFRFISSAMADTKGSIVRL